MIRQPPTFVSAPSASQGPTHSPPTAAGHNSALFQNAFAAAFAALSAPASQGSVPAGNGVASLPTDLGPLFESLSTSPSGVVSPARFAGPFDLAAYLRQMQQQFEASPEIAELRAIQRDWLARWQQQLADDEGARTIGNSAAAAVGPVDVDLIDGSWLELLERLGRFALERHEVESAAVTVPVGVGAADTSTDAASDLWQEWLGKSLASNGGTTTPMPAGMPLIETQPLVPIAPELQPPRNLESGGTSKESPANGFTLQPRFPDEALSLTRSRVADRWIEQAAFPPVNRTAFPRFEDLLAAAGFEEKDFPPPREEPVSALSGDPRRFETAADADAPVTTVEDRNAEWLARLDRAEFVQRMVRALEQARAQSPRSLEVELQPPALGKVRVVVVHEHGAYTARIETSTESARAVIADHLAQLDRNLSEHGIHLQRIQVEPQTHVHPKSESQLPGHHGQGLPEQRQPHEPPRRERIPRVRTEERPREPAWTIADLLALAPGMDRMI